MYAPDQGSGSEGAGSASSGARNARYAYLVGRLRNRQMTMEEATELFSIMQGMLQTSEAARAALMRVPVPAPQAVTRAAPPPRPPAPPSGGGDDFLLLGILAMGAGAGLLAAMTKRIQGATPPANSASDPGTPSKKV